MEDGQGDDDDRCLVSVPQHRPLHFSTKQFSWCPHGPPAGRGVCNNHWKSNLHENHLNSLLQHWGNWKQSPGALFCDDSCKDHHDKESSIYQRSLSPFTHSVIHSWFFLPQFDIHRSSPIPFQWFFLRVTQHDWLSCRKWSLDWYPTKHRNKRERGKKKQEGRERE